MVSRAGVTARPVVRWLLPLAMLVLAVFIAWLGPRATPATTPATCDPQGDLSGCAGVAVAFERPVLLAGAEAEATGRGGQLLALWREAPVCVTEVRAPSEEALRPPYTKVTSWFVYYHGDTIGPRRLLAPPPTTGGWIYQLWAQWAEQWQQVDPATTAFVGAALLVPSAQVRPGDVVLTLAPTTDDPPASKVVFLVGHERDLGDALGRDRGGDPC